MPIQDQGGRKWSVSLWEPAKLERDFMPRFERLLGVPKTLVSTSAIIVSAVGCSSLAPQSDGGSHAYYKESAADVINRAPSSMSVPQEAQPLPNDPTYLHTQADYHYALGETYSLQGDTARAAEEYKLTLVYDSSSPQVHVRLAAEYIKQGLVSEAMEEVRSAIKNDPKYIDAHLLLGGLYSAVRSYDEALKEYRLVQSENPDNYEAPLFIGAILAEQKKYSEAAEVFEKLGKNPNNTNAHIAWYYLGRVRLEENREKNLGKAETAFEQSIAARPSYPEATMALGGIYETTDRKDKAIRLFQAFQEKHGPSAAVAEDLSRLYIEKKEYQRALEQLAIVESSDPSDVSPKIKMAFILIEQQKYREAITRLEEVLVLEPASDKIRFYLGAVYEEVSDFKTAVNHFQKVPVGSSYYNESVIHAAYLYKKLGNYAKAAEVIQGGIKAKDDHAPFYALYAAILDDQKEYQKAVGMLTEATKKLPDQAQLHFFLGNMQDHVGDRDGTIASMKKVLEIDHDHIQALNFLAYIYAETGRDLAEAEKMARRALDLQPDDGYILDTLGWVLFKRGQYKESVRALEAAYKIQPNEAVIAEHLGDAYYQVQMPEKAKRLYQRAAEQEVNVSALEKIRSKIVSVDRQLQSTGVVSEGRQPASSKAH
jgi:tetratricopeptide (TPR) repeat protein